MQLTVCVHQRSVAASSVTAPTWCPLRRPRTQQQVGHMHCTVGDRRIGGGVHWVQLAEGCGSYGCCVVYMVPNIRYSWMGRW